MKKFSYISLCIVIYSLLFWGVERTARYITKGFTILNISEPKEHDARWEVTYLSQKEKQRALLALNQHYYLLSAGGQSYAFVSKDQKYILKITKHKRMRLPFWASFLPLKGKLEQFRETKKQKKKALYDATFRSYMIANNELKDFSHILYLHLNKTCNELPTITVIDNIGAKYALQLDNYEFILQRKGTLTYCYIDNLIYQNDIKKAHEAVRKCLQYVAHRLSLSLEDHDVCFGTNFGFIEHQPFQIDIGSLRYNKEYNNYVVFCRKIEECTTDLRNWLASRHPVLLKTYSDTLNELKLKRIEGPISYYALQ